MVIFYGSPKLIHMHHPTCAYFHIAADNLPQSIQNNGLREYILKNHFLPMFQHQKEQLS